MSVPFEVEHLRDQLYIVRAEVDGDPAMARFLVDEGALERLGVAGASEVDVVSATATFLLQRQRLDDLPTQVDVEDVAVAYDDFAEHLRSALGGPGG